MRSQPGCAVRSAADGGAGTVDRDVTPTHSLVRWRAPRQLRCADGHGVAFGQLTMFLVLPTVDSQGDGGAGMCENISAAMMLKAKYLSW